MRIHNAFKPVTIFAAAALAVAVLGQVSASAQGRGNLSGAVRVDGSSTVYPITEAVAEEFRKVQPKVRVTVGISGTGGGFKKFCAGETDIQDASRPIKKSEMDACGGAGIRFIELPVAIDGLSVMVNPKNDWVDHLTIRELNEIWKPGSTVQMWSDVRPGWPKRKIKLYGPGHDSGTFDYFTEAVNGKSQVCRADFTASEDDNVLVMGIAGDLDALGFFGYAYYVENTDKLKLVPIDGGNGPVSPDDETIQNGTYAPLSRPIFIYVKETVAERPEVQEFVRFYMSEAPNLVPQVGYIALSNAVYAANIKRFENRVLGTVYDGESHQPGTSIDALFVK